MKTTLNTIKDNDPCKSGWLKLLKSLGKTKADDTTVSLMHILKSNGIRDAVWALRCFEYRGYCLFLADVAESVSYLIDDKRVHDCIRAIRQYHSGKITASELRRYSNAAAYAANAAYAAAYAADAAYTAANAANAANAAANAADAVNASAYAADAAYAAANAAYDYAVASADTYSAREEKWKEIEELFVKHFGSE